VYDAALHGRGPVRRPWTSHLSPQRPPGPNSLAEFQDQDGQQQIGALSVRPPVSCQSRWAFSFPS
jgi:hypothetical protein